MTHGATADLRVRRTACRTACRIAQRVAMVAAVAVVCRLASTPALAQGTDTIPALTAPVNDFAGVVDAPSALRIEQTIRALQAASGDIIVVATVPTVAPYGDIREYAVKMFANGGRGIGDGGKDNGLLILLALKERQVRVEVGYALEPFVTDGFAGQVSRDLMTPEFRTGNYGSGLLAGAAALAQRVAQGRNVQLTGVPQAPVRQRPRSPEFSANWVFVVFIILALISRLSGGGPRSGMRRWGQGGWSGWSSGVGPFGGGFGGGGGGFGGGFGGFGGGRSGGGGGGSSW